MLSRVVRARARILGEDHADTLASRHKLARAIHEQTGRQTEAEAMLRSIVEAEKQVRGHEHYDTLVVRHTLARTMQALGAHREAEAEPARSSTSAAATTGRRPPPRSCGSGRPCRTRC